MAAHPSYRALLLSPLLAVLGCTLEPTAQEWQLDRTRVLAVRATPAEPRPGDTVSFEALTWSPAGELSLSWYLCLGLDMFSTDCQPDEAVLAELRALDWGAMDDAQLASWREVATNAGVLGIEPGLPPRLEIPFELLYALKSEELSEGLSLPIHVRAEPLEPTGAANEGEHVIKYLPVSLAETPNHNPELSVVSVNGRHYSLGKGLQVRAGASCDLLPLPAEDALESYLFVNSAGETEERDEEPEYRWYADGGDLGAWFGVEVNSDGAGPANVHGGGDGGGDDTGDDGGLFGDRVDDGATTWIAPDSGETGALIVVMLDQRGGMAWRELSWVVQ